MKNWMIALAIALAVCFTGAAFAGDVSNSTLADMGLAGMQKMSDTQGLDVRGEGFFHLTYYVNKYINAKVETDVDLKGNLAEVDATANADAVGKGTLTIVEGSAGTFTGPGISWSGLSLNVTSATSGISGGHDH